jgi:hypothetical protein
MPSLRFRSSCALAVVLVLAACNAPSPGMPPLADTGGGVADAAAPVDTNSVAYPDAHRADAATPMDAGGSTDAARPGGDAGGPGRDAGSSGGSDAGSTGADAGGSSGGSDAGSTGADAGGSSGGSDAGGSGGSGGGTGVISCYTEGSPGTTCTLPTHCCFTNYSSEHNGACSTAACTWGTESCDGPEDCAAGQHCCAHAIVTPDSGVVGYQLACQAAACGAAPANQELCHPTAAAAGTCSNPSNRCVTAFGNDTDLPPSLNICQ